MAHRSCWNRWSATAVVAVVALSACRSERAADVEVEVQTVGIDRVSHTPVVLLQETGGKRLLPVWIGAMEAQSIAMQVDGVAAPRPLTHDLVKNLFDGLGVQLRHVLIGEIHGGTYHARIFVSSDGRDLDFDSRPSDAIALALRFKRPIRVAPDLLREASETQVEQQAANLDTLKVAGITAQNLTPELAELFNVSAGRGVLVADVDAEDPKGLRRGDVILEVDGQPVYSAGELHALVNVLKKGTSLHFSVRRGSDTIEVTVPAG